jgi:UDP-N-acetylglucosamine 1-carboxyvinyltransferase
MAKPSLKMPPRSLKLDLANFCRAMGARIRGAGTNTITIAGVPSLHSTDYGIIPDRIEAGTLLVAGAITRSELSLSPVIPEHLTAVIAKLHEIGGQVGQKAIPTAVCPF